jgi:hypothetical protein
VEENLNREEIPHAGQGRALLKNKHKKQKQFGSGKL